MGVLARGLERPTLPGVLVLPPPAFSLFAASAFSLSFWAWESLQARSLASIVQLELDDETGIMDDIDERSGVQSGVERDLGGGVRSASGSEPKGGRQKRKWKKT